MKTLNLYDTSCIDRFIWPGILQTVDAHSPALNVLTDFREHKPLVVSHNVRAVDVEASMRRQHVRLKLVVDDHEDFLGIVSLDDLNEEEILKKVAYGFDRFELLVTDFMRPRHSVKSLNYAELESARISDLIEALKSAGQQHCLVLDRQKQCVRGLVSASDVARKMKLPVDLTSSVSFSRVYRALHSAT